MRWIWIAAAAALLILAVFVLMALLSQRAPERLGLQGGQLRPCPQSPNCVCSERFAPPSSAQIGPDPRHLIAPLAGDARVWRRLPQILQTLGSRIERQADDYMHVSFVTPLFRYVDDVELRFDRAAALIHIRSASRVGHSDFGVNRQRVERIRRALAADQRSAGGK